MNAFRRLQRALAAALGAAAFASSATAGLAPDELYRRVSPSVWQVATFDDAGKPLAGGSAVVVAPATLVTNCHVLKRAASVTIRQGQAAHRARLQHADVEHDLCQLAVPQLQAPAVPLAAQAPQIGQRIYTIGSPRGLEATLSDGLVSGLRRDTAGTLVYVQISAPISPGSSGGGLFDDEGRLMGITSSGLVGVAQNLNFARPAALIPGIAERATAALARWREAQAGRPAAPASAQPAVAAVAAVTPVQPAAPAPAAPPQQAQVPVPAPAIQPTRLASGYAPIDDVDAIPYLGDRGRQGYRDWLAKGTPRAFALASNGHWASSWGLKPRDPQAPVDAAERALWSCERIAQMPCKLYAVNNAVVWVKETTASAAPATAPTPEVVPQRP